MYVVIMRVWLYVCVMLLCRTMMIGAHKDGWWDEIKLMHQSEDVLDFLEAWDTENKYQFIGHFDQSVAHNKKNANALVSPVLCVRLLVYLFSDWTLFSFC